MDVIMSINLVAFRDDGSFVNLKNSKHKSFFVYNQTKYTWPDKYTVFSYGFNAYHKFSESPFGAQLRYPIVLNSSELMLLKDGGTLTSLWNNHRNDIVLSTKSAKSNLVKETIKFNDCINCGILYRNDQKDWIIGDHEKIISIKSFNKTSLRDNLFSTIDFLPEYYSNKSLFSSNVIEMNMGDPRFLLLSNGKLFVVFSRHNQHKRLIVIHAEIFTKNISDLSVQHIYINDTIFTTFGNVDQKNWTPFEFNRQLYFIVSIWPFHVAEIISVDGKSWIGNPSTISFQQLDMDSCLKWQWSKYEVMIRGGTQAIQLSNNTYFGIFHSSNNVSNVDYGVLQTYFMGAYTFVVNNASNKPLATLTGISEEPIAHESWYNDTWNYQPHAYGMFDYIVFPTSLILEDDDLFIFFGKQDKETWICRLKLSEILSTLMLVNKGGACSYKN